MACTEAPRRYFDKHISRAAERAVQRIHEQPPHRLQHQRLAPVLQRHHDRPAARRARRIIQRPEQPRSLGDERDNLLTVPRVVAQRNHVGPGGEQCARHLRRQTEPMRSILRVDDREIDRQTPSQSRQRAPQPSLAPIGRRRHPETVSSIQPPKRTMPRSVATASSDVVGANRHYVHLLCGEGTAQAETARQPRQGPVVEAAAVTQAPPAASNARSGISRMSGTSSSPIGRIVPKRSGTSTSPGASAEGQRLAAPWRHRQRHAVAPLVQRVQQRAEVDLVAQRPERRNDGAGGGGQSRSTWAASAAPQAAGSCRAAPSGLTRRPFGRVDVVMPREMEMCGAAMAVGVSSSQSLRVQVGARYRDQDPDSASSRGRCLLAPGMSYLTHRAAPPIELRDAPAHRQSLPRACAILFSLRPSFGSALGYGGAWRRLPGPAAACVFRTGRPPSAATPSPACAPRLIGPAAARTPSMRLFTSSAIASRCCSSPSWQPII